MNEDKVCCFGMDGILEREKSWYGMLSLALKNGREITGYLGKPYSNYEFGSLQVVQQCRHDEENGKLLVERSDLHLCGNTVWKFRILTTDNRDGALDTECRAVITKPDEDGLAVIDLLNADVLPSLLKGDIVQAQVAAYPLTMMCFENEEAYAAAMKKEVGEKPFLLKNGVIFPSAFLKNHQYPGDNQNYDEESDSHVAICGTIKGFRPGKIKVGEENGTLFHILLLGTDFGDIEVAFTPEQVENMDAGNMKTGDLIYGLFLLAGDVAIYEYANGIVRDEEHHFALLKNIFKEGCAIERLRSVLNEEAEYFSEHAGYKTFKGPDEIIKRFQYIRDVRNGRKYYAHIGTITEILPGDEELPYGVGRRCLILADEKPDKYESVSFIDIDEDGNILRLHISKNRRYKFKIDIPDNEPEESGEEELSNVEIENRISDLFIESPDDTEAVEEFIEKYEDDYLGDLRLYAFREAVRYGSIIYVENHIDEIDLNPEGYCPYLYDAADEKMEQFLLENGAFRSWDDYVDYRFAMETIEGNILAFDSDFQEEVFEKYLEFAGLTREELAQVIKGEASPELEEATECFHYLSVDDVLEGLGVSLEDDEFLFEDICGESGGNTREILENLGYDVKFEGESWKLETNGVYFVE